MKKICTNKSQLTKTAKNILENKYFQSLLRKIQNQPNFMVNIVRDMCFTKVLLNFLENTT